MAGWLNHVAIFQEQDKGKRYLGFKKEIMKKYKPEGYNAISPYLVVDGAQKMVELLYEIFDGKELRRNTRNDGSIMHTEVKIDDSIIMIGDAQVPHTPNQLLIHVYVSNVDETYARAIKAGCKVIQEPVVKGGDDTDKRGMFKDFAGNQWAVATAGE